MAPQSEDLSDHETLVLAGHANTQRLEHETIDIKVSMNKFKQQLGQELIANKNFYQDFYDGNIVNDFDQYMRIYRTVQFINL